MADPGPFKNFNFLVQINGLTEAGFAECSGLESSVGVIEYREGGDHLIRKLPGLRRFGNITLKRGVTKSKELQDWHKNILDGQLDRRNGVIILLDDTRQEVVRWNFFNAFPVKWDGPYLNAKGNDVAMESVELCCERIERE
jgi:phage tail-like protein